jgi:hypothetical protein
MAVTSEVDICNIGLSRLGNGLQISSLTENIKAARLCNLNYTTIRDAALRAHPWNFAIRRAVLAQDATAPAFEFSYRYALPDEPAYCLKIIRTSMEADGYPDDYRIEGRFLLSNEGSVSIEYIARITDVAQYDSQFVDVLAQMIAAELCAPLTENATMTKMLWDIYKAKLPESRTSDAQEGTPRSFIADAWISARI